MRKAATYKVEISPGPVSQVTEEIGTRCDSGALSEPKAMIIRSVVVLSSDFQKEVAIIPKAYMVPTSPSKLVLPIVSV